MNVVKNLPRLKHKITKMSDICGMISRSFAQTLNQLSDCKWPKLFPLL